MENSVIIFVITLIVAVSTNAEELNRIIGGLAAQENQFPYMVSLQQISEAQSYTRGHRCGGALISYSHVLTAASCTFNNNNGILSPINAAEFRVFAGSIRFTDDISVDRVRRIENITVHPQYLTGQPFVDDIAIITLTSPFSSNVVKPVDLSERDVGPADVRACTVSGWGAQNTSATASTQMMYSIQSIYDHRACVFLYFSLPAGYQLNIFPSMICAFSGQPVAAGCAGDLGNPLVCNNRLTGIAAVLQNCTQSSIPEVYTRVSSYSRWINGVLTGGASTIQPGLALLALISVVAAKLIS